MSKKTQIAFPLHPKQKLALSSPATEIMFGGAAGGGKSHFARVAAIGWALLVPGLQVYLFRRHYKDLDLNHMNGPSSFPVLLAPLVSAGLVKIVDGEIRFFNGPRGAVGSKIHLCHCQHETDVYKYQGPEIHVLILDECTHFTESQARYLRSRCRIGTLNVPERYAGMFPRVLMCTNPGNIGHNWVKSWFVTPHKPLTIWRTPKSEGGFLRQFIPALTSDNPSLDADYADKLMGLGDDALVKAMLNGDWNVVAGGALDDVIKPANILPYFDAPSSWAVDRCFDWGDTSPFSVLWVAEADGTQASNGFCPPRGSLIVLHEWYGAIGPGKGLKMTSPEIARGILRFEKAHIPGVRILPGPADNAINTNIPGQPSIADDMAREGVYWEPSDKSPGSRVNGLQRMRTMFKNAHKTPPEQPALYIRDNCRGLIARLPVLPRDPKKPDDVATEAEDHDYDALRYRVLSGMRGRVSDLRV
jgi:hypothetical protein